MQRTQNSLEKQKNWTKQLRQEVWLGREQDIVWIKYFQVQSSLQNEEMERESTWFRQIVWREKNKGENKYNAAQIFHVSIPRPDFKINSI